MTKRFLWRTISVLACSLICTACSEKILDFRNAEVSTGKIFEASSNEPFSGKVTNIPLKELALDELKPVRLVMHGQGYEDFIYLEEPSMPKSLVACDVTVKKGILDGIADCKTIHGDQTIFKIPYQEGYLQGELTAYSLKKPDVVAGKFTFEADKLNGKSEVFSPTTEKRQTVIPWKNNQIDGTQVIYYSNGKVKEEIPYQADIRNGEAKIFNEEGKLIQTLPFQSGSLTGISRHYDPVSGKIIKTDTYDHGYLLPPPEPTPIVSETSSDEVVQTPVTSIDDCVAGWVNAYTKAKGNTPIRNEMVLQWEEACKVGQTSEGYRFD